LCPSGFHAVQKIVPVHLVGQICRVSADKASLREPMAQGGAVGLGVNHRPTGSVHIVSDIVSFHHSESMRAVWSTAKGDHGLGAIRAKDRDKTKYAIALAQ
jgi:hypothetical protein